MEEGFVLPGGELRADDRPTVRVLEGVGDEDIVTLV